MTSTLGLAKGRRTAIAAVTIVLALAVTLLSPAGKAEAFTDVDDGDKFFKEITWLAYQQVTTGYNDGSFRPKDSVSREAFAAFLYRLADKPKVSLPSKSPFKDVPTSAQFYKEIVWLSQQGITTGWSDGTFRPKNQISREAIAAFLYRFEGRPSFSPPKSSPFSDMSPSSKFYKEVTWLSKTGMTTGYSDGTFRPWSNVTREAIAAFLYRGWTTIDGNGTYKVGKDIAPGIYTAVPIEWPDDPTLNRYCSYERRTDGTRSPEGVVGGLSITAPAIIEILETDTHFYTEGCRGWTLIRKSSPGATTFEAGVWAVGYHMKAGLYGAPGGQGCIWWKVGDFEFGPEEPLDWQETNGKPSNVRLKSGQGMVTVNCGVWKRIGD